MGESMSMPVSKEMRVTAPPTAASTTQPKMGTFVPPFVTP